MGWRPALAALLVMAPTQGRAVDWWTLSAIGQAPHRMLFVADRDSIRRLSPDSVEIVSRVYDETLFAGGTRYQIAFWRFHCAEHTFELLSEEDRRDDNSLVRREAPPTPQTMPAAAGTVFDDTLRFACGTDVQTYHLMRDPGVVAHDWWERGIPLNAPAQTPP
jgi:hypothetical protein